MVVIAAALVCPAASPATAVVPADCQSSLTGVAAKYLAQIGPDTSQVVVVVGDAKRSSTNHIQYWEKQSPNCWVIIKTVSGRNGYAGWSAKPTDGSGLSPVGVFGLTDAGGRLPNPGTALPYHYGPQRYGKFGYRMNNSRVQMFDYVVAINFNRFVGTPPRDDARPDPKIRDGGIWFHVGGAGATRGCVSVTESDMAATLTWLNPTRTPMIIMGNRRAITG